jgi:hypothetical protein
VKRREFITLLGGAAAAWPRAARAQRPSIPVIGFLDATTAADTVYRVSAFREGLKEAGFIEGHNVAIEFRWAENKHDRLPALAADLAQRQVAVIVGPNVSMPAALAATSTIPIVFISGGDPIASGLVTNLSRPGGNITGVSFASVALQPKRLGLLHQLVPPPATIAWLRDPRAPTFETEEKEVPPAARELGRHLLVLNAINPYAKSMLHLRPSFNRASRGRLQVQIRRAFLAGGPQLTSSAIFDWTHCRIRRRMKAGHRHSVRRILWTMADPIRRVPPHGAWLWRLRNSGDD